MKRAQIVPKLVLWDERKVPSVSCNSKTMDTNATALAPPVFALSNLVTFLSMAYNSWAADKKKAISSNETGAPTI